MGIKKLVCLLSFCICFRFVYAQTKISGVVVSNDNIEISGAIIVVKDLEDTKIHSFHYTDEHGRFDFDLAFEKQILIKISSLGFNESVQIIRLSDNEHDLRIKIVLTPQNYELNEIIIQGEKSVTQNRDTINLKTKFFVDGTEQTVEELLRKIPGVQVEANGTIKVGNEEIEKLMIDGDDFFERGYKILSKNMPAYPIEEVEILKNYSNNPLLKNIERSNKVALNLKLNEGAKRLWFGNIEAQIGNDSFYQFKSNLMNFGKKNKFYFFSNLNSIGYDAIGDIQDLIQPFRLDEPSSIGDDQALNPLLRLQPESTRFKRSRINFNNAKLLSLNGIFNITEKLKVKALGFFNNDETLFFRNTNETVAINNTSFNNSEQYVLCNQTATTFGKLDINYNMSKTSSIDAITKYNFTSQSDNASLIFNDNSTLENLEHQRNLVDQKINYTKKLNEKRVLLITGRLINEHSPQNYAVNQFFYSELFPLTINVNNVAQFVDNELSFVGFNAHLLQRFKNGNLFEVMLGNKLRSDIIKSEFNLRDDEAIVTRPLNFQNNSSYRVNDSYLKSKYVIKLGAIYLNANIEVHQLFNELTNNHIVQSESPLFINASTGFIWELNTRNKFNTSYSYNKKNAGILDVYSDFVLTGFRSFERGTGDFNQLSNSSLVFNYQLGNWSDRFFTNTVLVYNKNHDFFSTNTTLNQNFVLSDKILIKDRELLSFVTTLDYYLKSLKSNIKLDLGYTKSEFKNIVNNSQLRQVISNSYNYGFELRSSYNGVFNFHIGSKWSETAIRTINTNSFSNNISFLDLTFIFNKKFDLQIQSERYYFGNLLTNNTFYFLDVDLRYKLIENKLTIGLSGKNLFNTSRFREFSVNDIGSSTTEYRLLPRYVLFKSEYRF